MEKRDKQKRKQHILVISQYFYPEEFRINDICKEWVQRGYEVTVITGIPNYPRGKFYDGYNWFKKRREEYEGVHIIRIPIIPRGKKGLMLAVNYCSFVVSGFFWMLCSKVKADKVFIFEVSPMTQALVGVWYALKHKVPCHIYVQDLWPESVESVTGIHNKMIIGTIDMMVNYIYKHCDKIFATSRSFVKRIEERSSAWKGKESKVLYWPQYAESFYRPVERTELSDMPNDNKFKIAFTGNIGYAQGLDILPKTAALLKQKNVDCQFIIIGDGRYREEFTREIDQRHVADMFCLLGRKKPQEVPYYLAWCDVAFLSFADKELFKMTIPAKLQSYIACGMPILAVAGGETKRIVEEAGCGCVCELGDVQGVADAVAHLKTTVSESRNMADNALLYNKHNFDKGVLFDQISEYI